MSDLRIVSLLPSATEIVVGLGLGEQLVGRSHECDYPPWVRQLPACTSTKIEKGLTSRQIDYRVREIVRQGLSVYEVDVTLLRDFKPDLVLTQTQCAVCAVTPADLDEALAGWLDNQPTLVSLAPERLADVWMDIAAVARASGIEDRGQELVATLRAGLEGLSHGGDCRPRVAAIEWIDPLMIGGNWIPELIELAGGTPLLGRPGQHSDYVAWNELAAEDPEVIIVMPCGYRIGQSLAEMSSLTRQPGPRLVESARMIADMLGASGGQTGASDWSWVRFTSQRASA